MGIDNDEYRKQISPLMHNLTNGQQYQPCMHEKSRAVSKKKYMAIFPGLEKFGVERQILKNINFPIMTNDPADKLTISRKLLGILSVAIILCVIVGISLSDLSTTMGRLLDE